MTAIPNIKGRLPQGQSARDVLAAYWRAHGIPGPNPGHKNTGTVTFAWEIRDGQIVEWLVSQRESVERPSRVQEPGLYLAGTVDAASPELDPIRHKGIGSQVPFEEGDPDPQGTGLFYEASTGSFVRPFEQLRAEG